MDKNEHGMMCLNAEGTQFDDLPGIICFNISNLLNEEGAGYLPYEEKVFAVADAATASQLRGSDGPNLLTQVRAILLRTPILNHLREEEAEFDIVDIVTRQYPKGVMLNQKYHGSDSEALYRDLKRVMKAFKRKGTFYGDEIVEMVQNFEQELRGLHLPELMLYSDDFSIDSIMMGLNRMSLAEKILRRRINAYMEAQLTQIIKMKSEHMDDVRHVETLSLPLEIGERVAACQRFYNKFGGGAYKKQGILFAGSASGGMTFYDSLSDNFEKTIFAFYQEHVK